MVQIQLWEHKWNKKLEYTESNLVRRETVKEEKVKWIVEHIINYYNWEKVTGRYYHGASVGECYGIYSEKGHINLKFASKKQLHRFTKFMEEICTGEITEEYCR